MIHQDYICNLPKPIIIQEKRNGSFQNIEVETLYFKEPSINELRSSFAPVRNAFKQLQQSITQQQRDTQKEQDKDGENPLKHQNRTQEEARKLGYQMLEFIDSGDGEKLKNFQNAFKVYLVKGCCFTAPSLEKDTQLTMAETISDEALEEILAMYLGYFLVFFILRNPQVMEKYIA